MRNQRKQCKIVGGQVINLSISGSGLMVTIKVLCIVLAVLAVLYLLIIMPRMTRRPDREPYLKVLYAHRGLHDNSSEAPENSMAAF